MSSLDGTKKRNGQLRSRCVQQALEILGSGECDIDNCEWCKEDIEKAQSFLDRALNTFTFKYKVKRLVFPFF